MLFDWQIKFCLIFRYETESVSKIDDLEHAKMKLQARLAEAEDTIEGLNSRCTNLEKVKQKLATEVEDMQLQVGYLFEFWNEFSSKRKLSLIKFENGTENDKIAKSIIP